MNDQESTTENESLTPEDALIFLDEFLDAVRSLEEGKPDEETKRHVRRLVDTLNRLPLPPDVLEDHAKEIRGWTELLLQADIPSGEEPGEASDATLLADRLRVMRRMVDVDSSQP